MSQQNVDAVLEGYDAFNRGDLDFALVAMSPDIEWRVPDVLPDVEPVRGREGVRRFWERWTSTFDEFTIEIEEVVDAGDQVLVQALVRGRGKDSGAEVASPSFPHVWTFRGDLAVRVDMYPNKAAGLEAIGRSG